MINRRVLKIIPLIKENGISRFSVNHQIFITNDFRGIATHLAEMFKKNGYPHVYISEEIPPTTDVVISLEGLRKYQTIDEAINGNRKVFYHARHVAHRFTQKGGIFITVQASGGDFSFKNSEMAWVGGVSGLVKTAAHEWPKSTCQAIDIEEDFTDPEMYANTIFQHLLGGNDALECGITKDKAITHKMVHEEINFKELKLTKKDIIVVSGGARGITAACLLALAKKYQPTFVILGRTPLTEEPLFTKSCTSESEIKQALIHHYQSVAQEISFPAISIETKLILAQRDLKENLASFKKVGSEIHYFNVDILNLIDVNKTLASVQKKAGKITGIIHGAGILADKLISQKSDEQFDKVFNTKVYGLKNLLEATKESDLRLLLVFSSIVARTGNIGQCDYAMANEILNKVSRNEQQKRGHKCLVKSFNWGPWESGMVTPQLKEILKKRHKIGVLTKTEGAALFLTELTDNNRENVEVILTGKLEETVFEDFYKVNMTSHPFFTSHIIKKVPVLPACMALEWFAQTAKKKFPHLIFSGCQNFKVLKGIILINFFESYDEFIVTCHHLTELSSDRILQLKLYSIDGTLHYTADVLMTEKAYESPEILFTTQDIKPWPYSREEIYRKKMHPQFDSLLFHGKDLQSIASLTGFSEKGGSGVLYTSRNRNWISSTWQTDLLILDGILQLFRLWGFHFLNYPTLPTQINKIIMYDTSLAKQLDILLAEFTGETKGKYKMIADGEIRDQTGKLYASLQGIEGCAVQIN